MSYSSQLKTVVPHHQTITNMYVALQLGRNKVCYTAAESSVCVH